jgi:hypothetical protein
MDKKSAESAAGKMSLSNVERNEPSVRTGASAGMFLEMTSYDAKYRMPDMGNSQKMVNALYTHGYTTSTRTRWRW